MTKVAPEWVRTSDPVIRSPARYRWTTAPASSGLVDTNPGTTFVVVQFAYSRITVLVGIQKVLKYRTNGFSI